MESEDGHDPFPGNSDSIRSRAQLEGDGLVV